MAHLLQLGNRQRSQRRNNRLPLGDTKMSKKFLEPIHPGEILLEEFMEPMGISINELARKIKVPANRISEIVNKKRAITADTSLRLGQFFGISPDIFINLQTDYDMEIAEQKIKHIIKEIQPLKLQTA